MTVQVRPRSDASHRLVTETWTTEPPLPVDEYVDIYGNPVKRLVAAPGTLALRYDARCLVPDEPDQDGSGMGQTLVEQIPGENSRPDQIDTQDIRTGATVLQELAREIQLIKSAFRNRQII